MPVPSCIPLRPLKLESQGWRVGLGVWAPMSLKPPLERLVHSQGWNQGYSGGPSPHHPGFSFLGPSAFFRPWLSETGLGPVWPGCLGASLEPSPSPPTNSYGCHCCFAEQPLWELPLKPNPPSRSPLGPPETRFELGDGEAGGSDRQKANSSRGGRLHFIHG